ncbi:hypothetical protein [Nocardiopsis potens]|uniref:hypothetical protein n=1 Tax=Nocardiopsis potens TaxID=1246458 RepID=UPI0003477D37|nr:hypothetical protein [Nocardiopsis potens]
MQDRLIDPGLFSGDNSWGGAASDRAQNEAIRELNAELSSARRRLNSELKHIRGTLEQRIDRISASFDAFVELSDVRERLALFTPCALVRHRVLGMLDGAEPPLDDLPDPAGYWLAPCARGLDALLSGDVAGAQRHFSEGADRDPLRAGVFALLAAAVKAPEAAPGLAAWILPGVLPSLPEQVTAYQRVLLLLAVEGRFGETAAERALAVSEERLRDGEEGREASESAAEEVLRRVGRNAAAPKPPSGVSPAEPLDGLFTAAARLAAIRSRLEAAPPDGGDEVPDAPAELAEAERVLRLLVEEGSREEAPLVRRAAQLRAVVESSGDASADVEVPAWDAVTDPAAELLVEICTDADASPAGAVFARRLLAPELRAAAERCAEQVRGPLPDRAAAQSGGVSVRIGAQGADQGELAAGERRAVEAYDGPGGSRMLPIAIAAGGAVFAVGALLSGEMSLWAFAVGGFLVGGLLHLSERKKDDEVRTSAEAEGARLRTRVEKAADEWRAYLERAEETRSRAAGDLEAIRRLLASG